MWFEPMFAIHDYQHQLEGDVFDEFRIGLDHIAFGCASREELESWPARLDALLSSTVRSWIDHTGPVSHFGIRTTFSSSSFCRWVHRLPRSPVRDRAWRTDVCEASDVADSWNIRHFSIANPVGRDRADVPALLGRMPNALEELGPIEVQDLTFGTEVTGGGYVHELTLYFHPKDAVDS
jgi:hypothetical protein